QAIVDAARSQIGASYSWGTSNPGVSFDCSGLSSYAYAQAGIDLPRTSSQQVAAGTTVSKSEAQPGDLVVWPGHLGIYAGGDTVIDAGRSPGAVTERTIWGNPTFVTFRSPQVTTLTQGEPRPTVGAPLCMQRRRCQPIEASSSAQAFSQRRQASAQTLQCSCISACFSHSSAQDRHAA